MMKENTLQRYTNYSTYIKNIFGSRVQKLSINAGFTCPNRDGSLGHGGCTYCNNKSFTPEYSNIGPSITEQLNAGIDFFSKKYSGQKYLAYFQSYTNSYGEFNNLKSKYEEALSHPLVVGIVIGTRPDCIDESLLEYWKDLKDKGYYVAVEYGIESTLDRSLNTIQRGHNYQSSVDAIIRTENKGLCVGAHLILGLPGENEEDILDHAKKISTLPITILKLHQLQLIKNTIMAKQYKKRSQDFSLFSVEEYVNIVVKFLEYLSPKIVIERFISQSPKEILIAPQWGIKNFEFVALIEKELIRRDTWQGKKIS